MLLLLFIGITLTKQLEHDAVERQIANEVQQQREAMMDLWPRIDHKLATDFEKARKCYVEFHLWKATDCGAALSQVTRDLSVRTDKEQSGQ